MGEVNPDSTELELMRMRTIEVRTRSIDVLTRSATVGLGFDKIGHHWSKSWRDGLGRIASVEVGLESIVSELLPTKIKSNLVLSQL